MVGKRVSDFQKFFETPRKPHGYWVSVISVTKDKAEPGANVCFWFFFAIKDAGFQFFFRCS